MLSEAQAGFLHRDSKLSADLVSKLGAAKRSIYRRVNARAVSQDVWDLASKCTAELNGLLGSPETADADADAEAALAKLPEVLRRMGL